MNGPLITKQAGWIITYRSPGGKTIAICNKCEKFAFANALPWPKDAAGDEYRDIWEDQHLGLCEHPAHLHADIVPGPERLYRFQIEIEAKGTSREAAWLRAVAMFANDPEDAPPPCVSGDEIQAFENHQERTHNYPIEGA